MNPSVILSGSDEVPTEPQWGSTSPTWSFWLMGCQIPDCFFYTSRIQHWKLIVAFLENVPVSKGLILHCAELWKPNIYIWKGAQQFLKVTFFLAPWTYITAERAFIKSADTIVKADYPHGFGSTNSSLLWSIPDTCKIPTEQPCSLHTLNQSLSQSVPSGLTVGQIFLMERGMQREHLGYLSFLANTSKTSHSSALILFNT